MNIRYKIKNANNKFSEEFVFESDECGDYKNLKNRIKMYNGNKGGSKEAHRGMHWLLVIYSFKK